MKRTVKEIRALIESMKDEDAFPEQESTLTAEQVAPFLETADGQRLIQPFADRAVTKGLETYKAGTFEKEVNARVNAEILKRNPAETEQEKQIRELKASFESEKTERQKDILKRQILEEASRLGVKPFFLENYLPESLDVGKLYLNQIKNFQSEIETSKANEILLAHGHKPKTGNERDVPIEKMASGPEKLARAVAEAEKRLMSSD